MQKIEKNLILENKDMLMAYLKASVDELVSKKQALPMLKNVSDELFSLHEERQLFAN
mgnify:CR=1 FL=1